jgi:hypothetical protein
LEVGERVHQSIALDMKTCILREKSSAIWLAGLHSGTSGFVKVCG